jgi:hypothetical protein
MLERHEQTKGVCLRTEKTTYMGWKVEEMSVAFEDPGGSFELLLESVRRSAKDHHGIGKTDDKVSSL